MSEIPFQIGDTVCIREGIAHPGLHIPLSGWQGRVTAVEPYEGEILIGVSWDSVTLRSQPPEMHLFLRDVDWEWVGWVFTPEQLHLAEPQDTGQDAAEARSALLSQLQAAKLVRFPSDTSARLDRDEAPFNLPLLLEVLQIPVEEEAAVRTALAEGVAHYFKDVLGNYRYGKRPFFLVPLLMATPYPFGYGTLAILEKETISLESRKKLAYFACQTSDPFAVDAIPYGLLSIVSFLAAHGSLTPDLFRSVLLALELSGQKRRLAGWTWQEAQALSDWLAAQDGMPEAEKLWWLWHLGMQLDGQYFARLGSKLVPYWLGHAGLLPETRRELAWSWLEETLRPGQPPANWRLMTATFAGDMEAVAAINAEMELDAQVAVGFDEIMADLEKAPHVPPLPDPHEMANDPVGFLQLMMGLRFGGPWKTPGFVRKLAVQHLVTTLGEPATAVADAVFARTDDVRKADLQRGVVAMLSDNRAELPQETFTSILECVLTEGNSQARLRAYKLGAELLGTVYVQRAAADEAKSIRQWAARQ